MALFGDDVLFITDARIYSEVVRLASEAEERLTIVSPYLGMTSTLLRQLEDAASARNGLKIEIIFREDKLEEYQSQPWLAALLNAGVRAYVVPLLHAKLYVSESGAILTSMNLVSFSADNSHEVGVSVDARTKLYGEIDSYIQALLKRAKPVPCTEASARPTKASPSSTSRSTNDHAKQSAKAGVRGKATESAYCLACATDLPFDPAKPLCRSCYKSEALPSVCHRCGKEAKVTIEKPLCYSCFKSS